MGNKDSKNLILRNRLFQKYPRGTIVRIIEGFEAIPVLAGSLAEVQFLYNNNGTNEHWYRVNVENHGEIDVREEEIKWEKPDFVKAKEEMVKKHIEEIVDKDPELMRKLAEAEVSSGGSLRYNKGKPQFSHLSPEFIQDMMALMTASADKYGYLNWTKAQDVRTASDSLMRHFLKFQQGDTYDEESGYSHLTHVAVNAMIIFQNLKDFGDKVDNRFSVEKDKVQGEE